MIRGLELLFYVRNFTHIGELESLLLELLLDRDRGCGVGEAVLLDRVHLLVTLGHLPWAWQEISK